MAFKCKGTWDSWVGETFPPHIPPNDGTIIIGNVQPNKKFKGKHRKRDDDRKEQEREFDLDGECNDTPDHHIDFTTTEGFRYRGKITEKEFNNVLSDVAEGKRSNGRGIRPPDEDWVAVKVT